MEDTSLQDTTNSVKKTDKTLNRACEQCRLAKVKCHIGANPRDGKCRRCLISNRQCIFIAPTVRKPRKRTHTRISELEKKLEAMSNHVLHSASPHSLSSQGDDLSRSPGIEQLASSPARNSGHGRGVSHPSVQNDDQILLNSSDLVTDFLGGDLISQNLLAIDQAEVLFRLYLHNCAPQYPIVVFPQGTTGAQVRASRPVLFLAVVAAASGSSDPCLFRDLTAELLRTFAHKVVISNEKTMELVQAMLVMAAWYFPPDRFQDAKHYQYIHMAASMAVEIGLGEDKAPDKPWFSENSCSSPVNPLENLDNTLERYRTLLGCYLLCAGVSTSADRPNMLRFTSYMQRCIDKLLSSPSAAPTDRRLVAWVELQRLSEEVADNFRRQQGDRVSFGNTKTQDKVNKLYKKFEAWENELDSGVMDESLHVYYSYNVARVFEVALYDDHDVEDFRPPFLVRSAQERIKEPPQLSPRYVQAILKLATSVQNVMESFLSMTSPMARASTIMHHIRSTYALTILVELCMSSKMPTSELWKILDDENLKIEEALFNLDTHLAAAAGKDHCRTPEKFRIVLQSMQQWWLRQKSVEANQESSSDVLRPLLNLSSTKLPQSDNAAHSRSRARMQGFSGISAATPYVVPQIPLQSSEVLDTMSQSMQVPLNSLPLAEGRAISTSGGYEKDSDPSNSTERMSMAMQPMDQGYFDPFGHLDLNDSMITALLNDMSDNVAASFIPGINMDTMSNDILNSDISRSDFWNHSSHVP